MRLLQARSAIRSIGLAGAAALCIHCGDGSTPGFVDPPDAPPDPAPASTSVDVSCKADVDCIAGESCLQGVCQLPRCSEPPNPLSPPLGKTYPLARVQQLLAVDGSSTLRGYEGAGLGAMANGTWTLPASAQRVVGGAFLGTHEEAVAIADGSPAVRVMSASGATAATMTLPFAPTAIAAGDLDNDGVDDVVAIGSGGQIGVCYPATTGCDTTAMPNAAGVDVAAGNVSGDGVTEAVLLTNSGGSYALTVWTKSSAIKPIQLVVPTPLTRVVAGDIDGDGIAEIVALEPTGGRLHLYRVSGGALAETGTASIAPDAKDIAMGTLDGGARAELFVLRASNVVDVMVGKNAASLTTAASTPLAGAANATHLAVADVRGESAIGILMGSPTLVQGQVIPVVALLYPPYSADHSAGASEVILGSNATVAKSLASNLSLRASAQIGLSVDIPNIVKAGISTAVSATLSTRNTESQSMKISDSFTLDPIPRNTNAGGVLLAGACYHQYTYQISDPAGKLGADGKKMVIYAPVGGQKALWSIVRYNALARALGGLPIIPETYHAGDPSTYPKAPLTFGNRQIAGSDLVFTQFESYRVSDVAAITWALDMSQGQTNDVALSASASVKGSLGVGPVGGDVEVGTTVGSEYTISLGTDTSFQGTVPKITIDPKASTDTYGYSFTPIVYREHYKVASGSDLSFYVMTYTVGK